MSGRNDSRSMSGRNGNIEWAYCTERGKRENNEDYPCAANIGRILFAAVADGMGGHAAGEDAARTVAESLRKFYVKNPSGSAKEAAGYAKEELEKLCAQEQLGTLERPPGAVATWAVIEQRNSRTYTARIGHAGDTRAYVISGDSVRQITSDETTAEDIAGSVMEFVTNCFLPDSDTMANAYGISMSPGDMMLLTSDGVHGSVSDSEMSRIIKAGCSSRTCQKLCRAAIRKGSTDNVTAMLVRILDSA